MSKIPSLLLPDHIHKSCCSLYCIWRKSKSVFIMIFISLMNIPLGTGKDNPLNQFHSVSRWLPGDRPLQCNEWFPRGGVSSRPKRAALD